MLRIAVTDTSAENRNRLAARVTEALKHSEGEALLLPQINVVALTREELAFSRAPDILIVGDQLLTEDLAMIATIRRQLPQVPIVARLSGALSRLSVVEQVARLGADDVWTDATPQNEVVHKILLLARRSTSQRPSGRLILVDGGKGGVGVTSLTAALGDVAAREGKRTVLVDLDFESQDLSRFLQVRPFLNEALGLILSGARPATEEFVQQALLPVWSDVEQLSLMAPAPGESELLVSRHDGARLFLSVVEHLDATADLVIVDMANCPRLLAQALARVADGVVFAISADPAALFASVDRLSRLRPLLSADASLLVVENGTPNPGLPSHLLRREFSRAARLEEAMLLQEPVVWRRSCSRWPASGGTLASIGGKGTACVLTQILEGVGVASGVLASSSNGIFSSIKRLFSPTLRAGGVREVRQLSVDTTPRLALPRSTDPVPSDLSVDQLVGSVTVGAHATPPQR